ncbi:Na/Pi cotransporter family protein [Candidatus Neomarinimicrobiota bacterium]
MIKLKTNKLRIIAIVVMSFIQPLAGMDSEETIQWTFLIFGLLGGLALFLYGMEKMSDGLKKTAGDRIRSILSTLTNNRLMGLTVGAIVTMMIQSSSATTVMLVSFVQAQMMTFVQSLGVILGAGIGTTITAQLIASNLTDYALLMIAIGFGIEIFSKKDTSKHLGEIIMGFGILFFGMKLMSDAMAPLRTYAPFIDMLNGLENPLLGLLIGAVFTALIQSSSAFTGIIIVLAQQGLLTLEAGIPLILGSNLGTCVTAGLASIGASREAKRVALAHTMFKVGGILLFVLWIPTFADIIRNISPATNAIGLDKLAAETPRQIANAHTLFNVSLVFIFLPFTILFSKLILIILPRRDAEIGVVPVIWHLDDSAVSTPALAIGLAQTEISRMAKISKRMLNAIIVPFISIEEKSDEIYPQLTLREGIDMREEKIDFLEEKITEYLFRITREELSKNQASEVYAMMAIAADMESIGDVVHRNLVPLIDKKNALKKDFTNEGKKEIIDYHISVMKQISRLENALTEMDFNKANKILKKEEKYQNIEFEYRMAHIKRVQKEKSKSILTHEIHMDLMDMLKQIHMYLKNMAKEITDLEQNSSDADSK